MARGPAPDSPIPSRDVGSIDGLADSDGVAELRICTSLGAALNDETGGGSEGAALAICDGAGAVVAAGDAEAAADGVGNGEAVGGAV